MVVGPAEHRAELEVVEIRVGLGAGCPDLVVEFVGLGLFGQLDRGTEIVGLPDQRLERLQDRVQALELLDHPLGFLLVVPEGRAVHLLLERVAVSLLFAEVKESLGDGGSCR